MIPKSKLEIAKYEGLVTVFALMLAVEYASGFYDLWDVFIGTLSIYLGSIYWESAKKNNDFLYSTLTASLISLGIVSIISGCVFVILAAFGIEQPSKIETFWVENLRFLVFSVITFIFFKIISRKKTHNKSMQPTANAPAD